MSKSARATKPKPVEVTLTGHLTASDLERALRDAERELEACPTALPMLVECNDMTGYDTAAREYFVAWNARLKKRILKLAVVTSKPLWHLVVSGMALASGQTMKAFADRTAALDWLQR